MSVASLMEYDEFKHAESDYSLVGMRSGTRFRMGDKVRIQVAAANLLKRQLDYVWVMEETDAAAPKPKKGKGRKENARGKNRKGG